MFSSEASYKLVAHNTMPLSNGKLGVVSRENSGWAVMDAGSYDLLSKTLAVPTRISPIGPALEATLSDLWKSGLLWRDGETCLDDKRKPSFPDNVLLKLTDACNYACRYCYDFKESDKSTNLLVSKAKDTIDYVLSGNQDKRITFSFHGGEPLLSFKKITELVEYINDRKRNDQRVAFSVQTNGTLFTPKVIEFLDRHEFSVGISLDGSTETANAGRVSKLGKTPLADFEKLLREYPDFVRRRCGVMAVVSETSVHSIPEFALWLQDQGVTSLALVLLQTMGRGHDLDLDQVKIAEIISMYDTLVSFIEKGELHNLFVRNIISCLGNFMYFADGEICYRGVCMASKNFLVLAPNGSFKICDCSDTDEFNLGDSFDVVREAAPQKRIDIVKRSQWLGQYHSDCSRCEIFGLCGGGCAARASTNNGNFYSIDAVECELFRRFYRKFMNDYAIGNTALFDYFRRYERQGWPESA